MSDWERTSKAWERIHKACTGLEPQAIEVLAYIADRLVLGRKSYGDMELETDQRNMMKEISAELGDATVYLVMHLLQKAMKESKVVVPVAGGEIDRSLVSISRSDPNVVIGSPGFECGRFDPRLGVDGELCRLDRNHFGPCMGPTSLRNLKR